MMLRSYPCFPSFFANHSPFLYLINLLLFSFFGPFGIELRANEQTPMNAMPMPKLPSIEEIHAPPR